MLCGIFIILFLSGFLISIGYLYQMSFLFESVESERPADFHYKKFVGAYIDLGFHINVLSRKWEGGSVGKFNKALVRARFCLIYGTGLMAISFSCLFFFCSSGS